MTKYYVFTDASYSPQYGIGFGSYFYTKDIDQYIDLSISEIKNLIKNDVQYIDSSKLKDIKGCTNLEIFTIGHVLRVIENEIEKNQYNGGIQYHGEIQLKKNFFCVYVYTDCQKALKYSWEFNNEKRELIINKMVGHKKQIDRKEEEKIFDVVDKLARKKLRKTIKSSYFL